MSDDEIKSSYRRLAKAYHPDSNPQHEETFKEINEAFQTLKDKKKKQRYNVRYRLHSLQNIDFDAGISDFVGIFIGKDELENSPQSPEESTNLDEVITLSLTIDDVKNGVVKEINYSLPDGKTKKLSIKVPVDSKNGTKIRLKGEGRSIDNSSQKGDLYVKIDIINVDVNIKM
ncbi:MAG: J domain-containing protein [Clostridia bacterium]|nr:J domain-containing protein [Clostridia bacterium]